MVSLSVTNPPLHIFVKVIVLPFSGDTISFITDTIIDSLTSSLQSSLILNVSSLMGLSHRHVYHSDSGLVLGSRSLGGVVKRPLFTLV